MPALSKKQQKFFGIVRAIQKGEQAPTTPETAKAAADMKKSDVKKFASTKHKGLPEKKVTKEELDKNDKPFVKHLVKKLRSGSKTHAKQADDLEKAMKEESNPRIPRKKGQPANSKKHSDLYTDENPKGTIHGLGFKNVATAKASVSKYVILQDLMLIKFKRQLLWSKEQEKWVKPLRQQSTESSSTR